MKSKIKLAIIGLGCRGEALIKNCLVQMKDVEIVACVDLYKDRVDNIINFISKKKKYIPKGFNNYKDILNENIDGVIIATSWIYHVEIACAFMEKNIPVALEVGGAFSLEECNRLVDIYEKTKTPFMFLENCCYGEIELAVLRMVQEGVFGEVVACDGGYKHDLRDEISYGIQNRHYRFEEYKNKNRENYPTHEIGPIAKILNINYGNRFKTLSSYSSKSVGLKDYINNINKDPILNELKDVDWKQGDIVHTIITCENGEIIHICLDTTLPRPYSRGFSIHGTRALYNEDGNYFYFDNNKWHKMHDFKQSVLYNNGKRYAKKYRHPIWKYFKKIGVKGGHGGMDYLVLRAFIEALENENNVMPIDVYDAVSWMVISVLSDESIKRGGAVLEFPDFTNGKWKNRKKENLGLYYI